MSLISRFSCFRSGVTSLILLLMGGMASPASAASLSPGQLIKGSTSAVYYYSSNGQRLGFPHENIFKSWYVDFSSVQQISDQDLAAIPLGKNVTYRPGMRLVKITTDPKVYAVAQNGTLRWLKDEGVAKTLYGSNWMYQIDDIPDALFTNYSIGPTIEHADDFSPSNEIASSKIDSSGLALPPSNNTPPPVAASSLTPMPLISRNVPAYASASSYEPKNANDSEFTSTWRSAGALPIWLAYDLSSVPPAQRGKVDAVWYEHATYNYDITIRGDVAYNQPRDYQIQGNPAAGAGTTPLNGWVTLATVKGNTLHSRQHVVDMTGYNWIRIYVTAINGSVQNTDVAINFDIHDAAKGVSDSWMFYGDSITASGMQNGSHNGQSIATMIHAVRPAYWPVQENGGIGNYRTIDGVNQIPKWLPLFPGRYVGISLGTNDVNGLPCTDPGTVMNNLKTIATAVITAGKVPLIPHIPWARTPGVQQCAPAVNAAIDQLIKADPRILPGPDLYAFFSQNQGLISNDNLHPSPAGYAALRQQWAKTILQKIYQQN